uniref:C2H2-type domain-containing protein n=1 Tax=Homalodisca liturata TaxID=320908 RepID=A0A1B6JSE9_9HEMI
MEEEENETNASWTVSVEPEVEIQESGPSVLSEQAVIVDEQSSESDQEAGFHAVQEYESVLVDKMCEVCGNLFQAFELLNQERNKNPQLSTCETCSYYITPHSMEIENHNGAVDDCIDKCNNSRYSCGKCGKTFTRKDRLDRHQVTHSEMRPFQCKYCSKSFKRNDKLVEHIKMFHWEISVKDKCSDLMCDVCGDIDGVISVNVRENAQSVINLCEVCNLARQERMSDTTQTESKLFQCDLCPRRFSRKDHATRHRMSHLDVKPFECYICEKSFNRNDRLLRHMKIHPGAKPFACKVCSLSFTDREELKSHQMSHPVVKVKLHKCEICEKEYRDKDKLQRHLTTHVNYKPYTCELCGKSFKLQETLLSHQQVHSNWKPFKCQTCGMAFKIKETYKRHLLVHLNKPVYSCSMCSKTFKRSDKLKTHHLVHLDLKPFTCDICKSEFKRKDKYTRHRKQVHNLDSEDSTWQTEVEIDCDMCGKIFNCEDDLAEHKMVHYR